MIIVYLACAVLCVVFWPITLCLIAAWFAVGVVELVIHLIVHQTLMEQRARLARKEARSRGNSSPDTTKN